MTPWFDPSRVFIGGHWQAPATGETLPAIDPSTGQEIARIASGTAADIDAAVRAAQGALAGEWGALPAYARGRMLARLGQLVLDHTEALTAMEAADVGKPLTQARADVIALARYCEFYAGAADKLMGETIPFQNGFTVYTLREPHGVTGHIVPWNYPMQIIGRSVGAALAAGNACVLKPAEEACLTALAFADLARQAGLPAGALNVVPGLGLEAGAALTAHPGIGHISFTGSVATGRKVQAAAAEVPEWMATEVAGARAAGEAGWVEKARRGFDEMRGAAQRHEWEQLAVAQTGEGAYRVVSEAMRPLQLKFVVEMELPPATAGGEATAVAAAIQLRAARRGAAAEQALWVEVCTGELERRQRYDDARHSWMPSWWATGFYRDGSAPVRVGVLHAGHLDGVAGEVDVGMRALFDQEEWCGADGRSAVRRALVQAG